MSAVPQVPQGIDATVQACRALLADGRPQEAVARLHDLLRAVPGVPCDRAERLDGNPKCQPGGDSWA